MNSEGDDDAPAFTQTLSQLIYATLERDILVGRWLPETSRSLRKIAKEFDTSMQPVREAVGKLVGAAALEVAPGRSVKVRRLQRSEADEVWSMRMLLEGEAAARFAQRGATQEARALYRYTQEMRQQYDKRDIAAYLETMLQWNIALTLGSGAPLLIEMILQLRLRYAPLVAQTLGLEVAHDPEFMSFTLHMQDELIYAIETGDATSSRHLRASDLRSFQRYLYSRLDWKWRSPAAVGADGDPPSGLESPETICSMPLGRGII